jgi:hypothetical protein
MDLYHVNNFLLEAKALCELNVGQTIENKVLRAHRYSGSIRVTDLANAGKRGKKVDGFVVYDVDYVKDPKVSKLIDQFVVKLPRAKSYKMALRMAEGIKAEAERLGSSYPKVETRTQKGVDVAPGGFKKIEVNGSHLYVRADNDSFSVRDKDDKYNEQTCIAPSKGKKTAVKKFYAWAVANEKKLAGMTFGDVTGAMRKNGIDYHYYCAVD